MCVCVCTSVYVLCVCVCVCVRVCKWLKAKGPAVARLLRPLLSPRAPSPAALPVST